MAGLLLLLASQFNVVIVVMVVLNKNAASNLHSIYCFVSNVLPEIAVAAAVVATALIAFAVLPLS